MTRMYILDSAKKVIHNSDFIERFAISIKPDAVLICAAVSMDKPLLTIGKYADEVEARDAFKDLFAALCGGASYFEMPDSIMFHQEREKRDARTKRKGGS